MSHTSWSMIVRCTRLCVVSDRHFGSLPFVLAHHLGILSTSLHGMSEDYLFSLSHLSVKYPCSECCHFEHFSPLFTARSELRKGLFLALSVCGFFVCVWSISGTAERICTKFTRKTCLVPRLDEFEGQGQRSNVKITIKNCIFGPIGGLRVVYVW